MSMTASDRADVAIADHVLWSLGAAAVPVPLVDIAAVTAVQLDLVADLARIYDADWEPASGTALVSSIVGASLPRVGASAVKAMPGLGWIAGALTQVGLSGASTWALGQVFKQHFAGDRELDTIDVKVLRQRYARHFDERRRAEARRTPRGSTPRPARAEQTRGRRTAEAAESAEAAEAGRRREPRRPRRSREPREPHEPHEPRELYRHARPVRDERSEPAYDARSARRLSRILEELEHLRASDLISDAEYQNLKTQALRNG